MFPKTSGAWEKHASIEDLARIAEAADRLGYHHLTCSEHIALPAAETHRRGTRYWDPLATFGYLAARTQRIRLATNVLVLGYHHPLEIAKRYGTLDKVSNGRLILGVGVGSLKEEFDLIGAPFDDRGPRGDDALEALRASLSVPEPAYHGEFYSFDGMVVDPCAVQARVPIWIGGRTLRSLRRAATLADGWAPFNVSLHQAREWLGASTFAPDSRSSCHHRQHWTRSTSRSEPATPSARPPHTAPPSCPPSSPTPRCSTIWTTCRRSPSCSPPGAPRDTRQGRHIQPHRRRAGRR